MDQKVLLKREIAAIKAEWAEVAAKAGVTPEQLLEITEILMDTNFGTDRDIEGYPRSWAVVSRNRKPERS